MAANNIYRTTWQKPFINGKFNPKLIVSSSIKVGGCYLIKDRNDKIVYVGYSETNIYKTLTRHFQKWKDISRTHQTRFYYDRELFTVKIYFCHYILAAILEKYFIQKHDPKDNKHKYEEINFNKIKLNKISSLLFSATVIYYADELPNIKTRPKNKNTRPTADTINEVPF